jgi:hypothetical protein
MSDQTVQFVAQRRQLLRTALQAQIDAGTLTTQVVEYIDELYARHRPFEAERIAGLALWVGTVRTPAWRETCFEALGTVLHAVHNIVQGVAALQVDDTRAGPRETQDTVSVATGLPPMVAARWCQLGHCLLPLTAESLRERGERVQQLLHWIGGTTTLAELGLPQTRSPCHTTSSLPAIEQAGQDALAAIQTVSRCLWQVRVQRAWAAVATSCNDFLEREVGVGARLGAALIALGQDDTVWNVHQRPLGRLAIVATLLARAMAATAGTSQQEYGGSYE